MSHRNKYFEWALVCAVGLILLSIFFRRVLLSHFDLVPADLADGRFLLVILEHWFHVFSGQGNWLNLPFFYPLNNNLGYSDAMFLYSIPYSILRALGIDLYTSYQITIIGFIALGFYLFVAFLKVNLKLNITASCIGGMLAIFNNVFFVSQGWVQLHIIALIPLILILIARFLRNIHGRRSTRIVAGLSLSVLIPLSFFTGYYVSWFLIFFLSISGLLLIIYDLFLAKGQAIKSLFNWLNLNRLEVITYGLVTVISFLPFFIVYLPVLRKINGRPFEEVLVMLPRWYDFFNVGPVNVLWGNTFTQLFPIASSRPLSHELEKAIPLFTMLAFFFFSVIAFSSVYRSYVKNLCAKMQDECYESGSKDEKSLLLPEKDYFIKLKLFLLRANFRRMEESGPAGLEHIKTGPNIGLVVLLSLTTLICSILLLRVKGHTMWWFVYSLIPGAAAIRAAFRFQLVLAFAVAIVISVGLNDLLRLTSSLRIPIAGGLICILITALLFMETLNLGSNLSGISKHKEQGKGIGLISPAPDECKLFFVKPNWRNREPSYFAGHVDAMLIAERVGIPTINGYSGVQPKNWTMWDVYAGDYQLRVADWLNYNGIKDGVCSLDLGSKEWLIYNVPDTVHMTAPLPDDSFRLDIFPLNLPEELESSEKREIKIRIRNDGRLTLSSLGINNDMYAIRLSYQWIDATGANSGFDDRFPLTSILAPEESAEVTILLQAPTKSGTYKLQIDAVQELAAWFHDKGSRLYEKSILIQ